MRSQHQHHEAPDDGRTDAPDDGTTGHPVEHVHPRPLLPPNQLFCRPSAVYLSQIVITGFTDATHFEYFFISRTVVPP